jgi:hypothetical protein
VVSFLVAAVIVSQGAKILEPFSRGDRLPRSAYLMFFHLSG